MDYEVLARCGVRAQGKPQLAGVALPDLNATAFLSNCLATLFPTTSHFVA